MLHADPFRDREIRFTFESILYKAKFTAKGVVTGWRIYDPRGIICPEHQMPELWEFFRNQHEPMETKHFPGLKKP